MRTGSIGNRDAETLLNTLVEPKRTILLELRTLLVSLGYAEEAGYDAINIESYVSYSFGSITRFIFKHKWDLVVTLTLQNEQERGDLVTKVSKLSEKEFQKNEEDGTVWCNLDPKREKQQISEIARIYATTS